MDIDDDVRRVFIEEADELMGGLVKGAFDDWRQDATIWPIQRPLCQRQLHTLERRSDWPPDNSRGCLPGTGSGCKDAS